MRINQFHSGIAFGDAITNQILLIQEILKKNGYSSEIYAEHIPEIFKNKIYNIHNLEDNDNDILIVHHSMGFEAFNEVIKKRSKKILIYHNITPEEYFDNINLIKYVRKGLEQTKEYKNLVDYVIADSNYNRRDLIHMGFENNIDVMPVSISLNRFENIESDDEIIKENKDTVNILFVGRVVENKHQKDIIKVFQIYHNYFNKHSKLFLVGDIGNKKYVEELKITINDLNLTQSVFITGKVSEEKLKAYFEISDIFLCMSEHEGFCVPLLEAMKMGLPVIAYASTAIPETMDGAGILFIKKNIQYIAALIDEIVNNNNFKNKIIERQYCRIDKMDVYKETENILLKAINNVFNKDRKKTLQIQGPFESSYSLAIVNRKLAEELNKYQNYNVSIRCTEGPGDYEPKENDLAKIPTAKELWEKSKTINNADITIRNMYPPRVYDVNGGLNFLFFGWEESIVPSNYIDSFNRYLDGIGTMSNYVTDILLQCGLKIPVQTIGVGAELCDKFNSLTFYRFKTKKNFKFLHISSAFTRKGIDILLKGYFEAFTNNDDVCLILKTFPNPHNNVNEILEDLRKKYKNAPEIEWINKDLNRDQLCSLYKSVDCYVSVSRGEGFGLPIAEAMLSKLPVIVSPNSGMADFCTMDTALLVDYKIIPANTHLTKNDRYNISMWAEPDYKSLVKNLRYVYNNYNNEVINKLVENAYNLVKEKYSWKAVSGRWLDFIKDVEKKQYKPKVAMITTWNSKCGIAEYTKLAIQNTRYNVDYSIYPNYGVDLCSKDEKYVKERCWGNALIGNLDNLINKLLNSNEDIVHFQFNFSFYKLNDIAKAIELLKNKKKIIITFHSVKDTSLVGRNITLKSIKKQLNLCDAIIVHQKEDVEYLESIGIVKKIIKLIPLGQIQSQYIDAEIRKRELNINNKIVLSSYGFFLPHKGIKEVILAIPKVLEVYPDLLYMPICAAHESVLSKNYIYECINLVEKLKLQNHVMFITEYLTNDESIFYLQASDLICLPYKDTKESASGAIRFCIAAQRPIITTKQHIFEEFSNYTYQITKSDPDLIAKAVIDIIENKKDYYIKKDKEFINKNSWHLVSIRLYDLYNEVVNRKD